jgi:large-conductance mechanosensitive channel
MQSIIFITLSVIIMGFVLFLGVKAIQKGLNAKNNKEFNQEKSDELNNSISEELEKLNKLFKSGAISEEDFHKAKKKILD